MLPSARASSAGDSPLICSSLVEEGRLGERKAVRPRSSPRLSSPHLNLEPYLLLGRWPSSEEYGTTCQNQKPSHEQDGPHDLVAQAGCSAT